ncbi:unnamed protein product [Prunus armeniaca]|uniref:Uncharacterized protein n=1 Tax=Prunus armeniaca TaxID=36596 RepID=A0A6J5WDD9_PRUAR|nr:unnamed protein product [Prunus armeniaca]
MEVVLVLEEAVQQTLSCDSDERCRESSTAALAVMLAISAESAAACAAVVASSNCPFQFFLPEEKSFPSPGTGHRCLSSIPSVSFPVCKCPINYQTSDKFKTPPLHTKTQ